MANDEINELEKIPQVSLITCAKFNFAAVVNFFIKKIICLSLDSCQKSTLCTNCLNFQNNNYFDLTTYSLSTNNYLKKQDIKIIIDNLSLVSSRSDCPKICIIINIEYSTLEASNAFLKFLENVPENTYLIFLTSQINQVLATIKSRCQIFSEKDMNYPIVSEDQELDYIKVMKALEYDFKYYSEKEFNEIYQLVNEFLENDNQEKFDDNFLLIKDLVNWGQKAILFFDLLALLSKNKIMLLKTINQDDNSQLISNLLIKWKNNNYLFLVNILTIINEIKKDFNNKTNLNLLFNYFFIKIYQGT